MNRLCRKIGLPSELISLNKAQKFVQEFCSDCGVLDSRQSDVQVAVLAAVSNAIQYGHRAYGPRLFYVECNLSEMNSMKFVVTDCGLGFDFENITDPTDPSNSEHRGRGIYLMRNLADKCTFYKNGTEVVLEFDLGLVLM